MWILTGPRQRDERADEGGRHRAWVSIVSQASASRMCRLRGKMDAGLDREKNEAFSAHHVEVRRHFAELLLDLGAKIEGGSLKRRGVAAQGSIGIPIGLAPLP